MPRRFPTPWSIEESSACFIVRDGDKQALAYVYFENEPGRRSSARLLTRDEAFLIAVNIAKLPSCQAAKRAAADIEGHSTAAKFGQPRRLIAGVGVRFAPQSDRLLRRRGTPLWGHVWTVPAVQEESDV
jgi:hypothetical protein